MPEKRHKKPSHQSAPDGNSKPTEHCKLDAGTVYSVRVQPNTKDQERYTEEKEYRRRQIASGRTLNIITAVAAVFVFIYAAITYLQWRELRHNFEVDQRAWIGVKDITLSSDVQEIITVAINVINSGKTPAFDVHLADISAGNSETDRTVSGASHEIGSVTPGTNDVFYVDLKISNGMIRGLMERTSKVYVRGRIEYRDIFEKTRSTEFCVYYPSPVNLKNFFNCPNGGSRMK